MRAVTVYKSEDGCQFSTESECVTHEQLLAKTETILSLLKPVPGGCGFSNGEGFVQQDQKIVESVHRALVDLFHETYPDNCWISDIGKGQKYLRHHSHFDRYCDDTGSPVGKGFRRLGRIDDQSREWGQPYFANNPSEGKQVEVSA